MSRQRLAIAGLVGALAVAGVVAATSRPRGPTLAVGAILGASPREDAARKGLELAREALASEVSIDLRVLDPAGSAQRADEHLQALEASGVHLVADLRGGSALLRGCIGTLRRSSLIVVSTDPDPNLGGLGERFFRVAPWDGSGARELAEWTRDLRVERPAVVVREGHAGASLRDAFVRARVGLSQELVLELSDPVAQAGWVAGRLGELQADAVVLLVPAKEGLALIEALQPAGSTPLIFTLEPELPTLLGASSARALLPRLRLATPEVEEASPARAAVDAAWARAHGGAPPPEAYEAWDALHALVEAWRASEGDLERTLARLRATDRLGASGRVQFLGDGERTPAAHRRRCYTVEGVQTPWTLDAEGL